MAFRAALIAVGLILAIGTANGLKCYNCNSKDSVTCGWGLTSFTYNTEECGSAGVLDAVVGPKCFKITATNREGKEYIARGCQNPPAFGCSAIAGSVGWIASHTSNDPEALSNLQCVTCDSDKCNSASKVVGVTFLGLLLATLAFLF